MTHHPGSVKTTESGALRETLIPPYPFILFPLLLPVKLHIRSLVPLLANHPGLGQETPAKLANDEVHDSLILSRKLITRSSFLETSDVASWHVIGSFPLVLSRK